MNRKQVRTEAMKMAVELELAIAKLDLASEATLWKVDMNRIKARAAIFARYIKTGNRD